MEPILPCPATAWQRGRAKDVAIRNFAGLAPRGELICSRSRHGDQPVPPLVSSQNQRDLKGYYAASRRQLPVERGRLFQDPEVLCADQIIQPPDVISGFDFDSLMPGGTLDGPPLAPNGKDSRATGGDGLLRLEPNA